MHQAPPIAAPDIPAAPTHALLGRSMAESLLFLHDLKTTAPSEKTYPYFHANQTMAEYAEIFDIDQSGFDRGAIVGDTWDMYKTKRPLGTTTVTVTAATGTGNVKIWYGSNVPGPTVSPDHEFSFSENNPSSSDPINPGAATTFYIGIYNTNPSTSEERIEYKIEVN